MLAPSPEYKVLKRMGYIKDQEGILNRYLRESKGWEQHLENTSGFILECLKNKKVRELVVFGSGWLLDFPLDKLAGMIENIKLVDIYHPPQILKKVKKYRGVECISADITGGYIAKIFQDIKKFEKQNVPFVFPAGSFLPEYNFHEYSYVISLNILNQLDILLTDYLKKKIILDEGTLQQIRKRLQNDHLDMIKKAPYILITDYEELLINRDGEEGEIKNLLYGIVTASGRI